MKTAKLYSAFLPSDGLDQEELNDLSLHFGLVELLEQNIKNFKRGAKEYYEVQSIIPIKKGGDEFEEKVNKEIKIREALGTYSAKTIESLPKKEIFMASGDFRAIMHPEGAPFCPYRFFISSNSEKVAIIHPESKEVIITPYAKTLHEKLFYYFLIPSSMKLRQFSYSGTMKDALIEFSKKGYKLHTAILPEEFKNLPEKELYEVAEKAYEIAEKNIPIKNLSNILNN